MTAVKQGYFDMMAAPLRVGAVTLRVRDLTKLSDFYQNIMGLQLISETPQEVRLGVAGQVLLILDGNPSFKPLDPREAGLFHTAFLMPERADLGKWLGYVVENRVPMQGASDHLVSEALYLADPEGNGIEVYTDRPTNRWRDAKGDIKMTTDQLDLQDLFNAANGEKWAGYPADGTIGHVHLQVGATELADPFYAGLIGMDISARYHGASFYGSGGYHHQLAGNIWNSRGAGPRDDMMAGLGNVELIARDTAVEDAILEKAESAGANITAGTGFALLQDPWGTQITLKR